MFPSQPFELGRFGAVEGGTVKNTEVFRKAIETAAARGGGVVMIPPGRWLTGPIRLKSRVNLHLASGAEVLFSQDFSDYLPVVKTRWEGIECMNYAAPIYCDGCTDVAITGSGKLNGQGQVWWPWKKLQKPAAERLYQAAVNGVPVGERVFGTEKDALRPSFIQFVNSKNVLIEGVTITDGPMWTIHPIYSENVIVRGVKVITHGPNGDGLNPDSCRDVLVEDSFFSTSDDCVVIKSGLNEEGWRVGKPSENIVVRRVTGEKGHGGVVMGSEMSGGIRNVLIEDCSFQDTDRGLRIKSLRGRGGVVENVWYRNVAHRNLRKELVHITALYPSSTVQPRTQTPPTIRGIHLENFRAEGAARAMVIQGLAEMPVFDVTVEQVEIAATSGISCTDCEGFFYRAVHVNPISGPGFMLTNNRWVVIQDSSCTTANSPCIRVDGGRTSGILIEKLDAQRASSAVAVGQDVEPGHITQR